jgi:mycothiol synthase
MPPDAQNVNDTPRRDSAEALADTANQPAPLPFRRFQPTVDLARQSRLYAAIEAVDQDGEDTSETALRETLTWPGHDPLLDRWVVAAPDDPDTLIGFASLWKGPANDRGDVVVKTHPAWRRRGIGGALLTRILARARERGCATVGAYVNVRHAETDALLLARGFTRVSNYTRMRALGAVARDAAEPCWPAGFTVRSYADDQRFDVLLTAFNTCFLGQWGHNHLSADDLRAWLPSFDASSMFIAFAPDGAVAGMCRAEAPSAPGSQAAAPTGHLDAPGVAPAYRALPLRLPLALTGLRWLGGRGAASGQPIGAITLESWGDDAETLALYQTLDFVVEQQEHSYRWDVV